MDWKRNYRVAKRFYETLKWTGNVIIELRNDSMRDVKMDWKRNYGVAKRFYETLKWTGNVIIELRNDSTRR